MKGAPFERVHPGLPDCPECGKGVWHAADCSRAVRQRDQRLAAEEKRKADERRRKRVAAATVASFNECDVCGKPVTEPGALVFGPPRKVWLDDAQSVRSTVTSKFHVCMTCWIDQLQDIVMPNA